MTRSPRPERIELATTEHAVMVTALFCLEAVHQAEILGLVVAHPERGLSVIVSDAADALSVIRGLGAADWDQMLVQTAAAIKDEA